MALSHDELTPSTAQMGPIGVCALLTHLHAAAEALPYLSLLPWHTANTQVLHLQPMQLTADIGHHLEDRQTQQLIGSTFP